MMPHIRAEEIARAFQLAYDEKVISNLHVQLEYSLSNQIDFIQENCEVNISREFIEMILRSWIRKNYDDDKESNEEE